MNNFRAFTRELCELFMHHLSKNSVFIAYFKSYPHNLNFDVTINSGIFELPEIYINRHIVKNFVNTKSLNAWTLFIKKLPNNETVNQLYYIYSKQPYLSKTILKKYGSITRPGIIDIGYFIKLTKSFRLEYRDYAADGYSDLQYKHDDITLKHPCDPILYIMHDVLSYLY